MIDLNHCYLFTKLVDAGSFTKAATMLKMPKSRVSRQLSQLEAELGVPLIYRTTRHFQLSEAGGLFYARAKSAIAELDAAVQEATQNTTELRGVVRMTAPEDVGVVLLPPIVDTFRKMHPLVQFEINLSNSVLNITKEAIDIAIRIGKLTDSALRVRRLGDVTSYIVASPEYARRLGDVEKPGDLLRGSVISFGDYRHFSQWRMSHGKKEEILKVTPKVLVNNFFMVRDLVLRDQGIAKITRFIVRDDIKHGNLVRLLPQWLNETVPISIVTQPEKHKSVLVKTFVGFLSDQMGEEFR